MKTDIWTRKLNYAKGESFLKCILEPFYIDILQKIPNKKCFYNISKHFLRKMFYKLPGGKGLLPEGNGLLPEGKWLRNL